jgi:hypothetical protein
MEAERSSTPPQTIYRKLHKPKTIPSTETKQYLNIRFFFNRVTALYVDHKDQPF